ncbi:hypothetical protein LEMLEM_LOCUS26121 [Lemmus lemmus]
MEWSDPRVHEQRETSGSLVASDLTQAHRAAAGSPRPTERKGKGMQLRGWREDAGGTGAEAGQPRRCPGKLGDPVRRRVRMAGPHARAVCRDRRGSDRPVRDRVPTPETAGKAAALRDKAAPSGSRSCALARWSQLPSLGLKDQKGATVGDIGGTPVQGMKQERSGGEILAIEAGGDHLDIRLDLLLSHCTEGSANESLHLLLPPNIGGLCLSEGLDPRQPSLGNEFRPSAKRVIQV